MTGPATLRCVLAAVAGFVVAALVFSGVLGGAMSTGSDAQYVFIGLAALLAPLTATVLGAWQARAGGATRPAVGILVAAVIGLVLGLLLFATNKTERDSFNAIQVVLVPIGVIIGAGVYGSVWFRSTTAR